MKPLKSMQIKNVFHEMREEIFYGLQSAEGKHIFLLKWSDDKKNCFDIWGGPEGCVQRFFKSELNFLGLNMYETEYNICIGNKLKKRIQNYEISLCSNPKI